MSNPMTPMIEENRAVFLFSGPHKPFLVGDFNQWDDEQAIALEPIGEGLWRTTLALPEDAYMEYAFIINGARVLDPTNPRRVRSGLGSQNNYFYMPGAAPSTFATRSRLTGAISRHRVEDSMRLARPRRDIILYAPATNAPVPLVVVFDGLDYLRRGRLVNIVENLIAAGRIRPVALALVHNAGAARFVEYACNDSTVSFIINRVVPLARQHLHLVDPHRHPGAFATLGASMGGAMALYTALRYAEVFGKVIAQAGAFQIRGEDLSVFDLIEKPEVPPLSVWMDCGRFDFLLGANRRMRDALARKGCQVAYREMNAGHNYTAWRDDLSYGLEHLFGG